MKIVVLNGSPKGKRSITLRLIEYVRRRLKHRPLDVEVINVSARIKGLEGNRLAFDEVIERVRDAELVLWASPLYVFTVPAQYMRFIELIFEREAMSAFQGKPTAVLTSSIKFFDCTAHDYLRAISDDLEMSYLGAYSAEMDDLLSDREKERLLAFFLELLDDVDQGRPAKARFSPEIASPPGEYAPSPLTTTRPTEGRRVLVIVDHFDESTNLGRMITRYRGRFDGPVHVAALDELKVKGGCLGCCRCGLDYRCRWDGKDDFNDFYRDQVMTADILIFASELRNRFISSTWKRYFDRSFFNTHTPSITDKQLGVLLSGPLRQLPHVRQFFEGYAEWQGANLVDIVTDEPDEDALIDDAIDGLVERQMRFARRGYVRPKTFLGVGGLKIFRDEIWGKLRFVFPADHAAFKARGVYDFPHKDVESRVRNAVMKVVTTFPPSRRGYLKNLTRYMVAPHIKAIEQIDGSRF